MVNIYEMLSDRGRYPDTFEITAPNGEKATLGDFRQVFFAREAELSKQAGKIQDARAELASVFQGLMAERESLAAQKAAFEAAGINRQPAPQPANNGGNTNDERMARLERALAENERKLAEVSNTTAQSVLQYVDDRFRSDLEGATLPEGITAGDVVKFAQANNIMSGRIPDLKKALEKMTEPSRQKAREEKIAKDAYEKGVNEATIRQMSANSRVIPPGESPFAGKKKFNSLEEAEAAAAADPEIQGMLAGVIPAPAVTGL